jgi:hypothetical protein
VLAGVCVAVGVEVGVDAGVEVEVDAGVDAGVDATGDVGCVGGVGVCVIVLVVAGRCLWTTGVSIRIRVVA